MTRLVWRIATDTPTYEADDLSGLGAKRTGGRWNEQGLAVVYAASSVSLAALETVVHLGGGALPLNRYLVSVTIPDEVMAAARIETTSSLPVGWDAYPASRASIKAGSDWLRSASSALMVVPSVIVPEETNLLINPNHADAKQIAAKKVRRWLYDPRLRAV